MSYGVLYHRGASSYSKKNRERSFTVKVYVSRNIGASRANQFCAWAKINRGTPGYRGAMIGLRSSADRVCAATPTTAAKRALRVFLRRQWSR